MRRSQKAFTLIELLVVVAIIGILAAVVLAALKQARDRAADAKVKSTMVQMRAQAELYRIENGSYGTVPPYWGAYAHNTESGCEWGGSGVFVPNVPYSLDPFLDEAVHAFEGSPMSGAWGSWGGICEVGANGQSWMAAVRLRQGTNQYWCVDSSGASKQVTIPPITWPTPTQALVRCP